MSSWRGSNVQTTNLASAKSFGAHAAEAIPPGANRLRTSAPTAVPARHTKPRRGRSNIFAIAERFMPRRHYRFGMIRAIPTAHATQGMGLRGGCVCRAEPLTAATLPRGENEFLYVHACRRSRHVRRRVAGPFSAARVARTSYDRWFAGHDRRDRRPSHASLRTGCRPSDLDGLRRLFGSEPSDSGCGVEGHATRPRALRLRSGSHPHTRRAQGWAGKDHRSTLARRPERREFRREQLRLGP